MPGVLLDGPHQQLRAAVGVGGVDLRGAVAGDVDRASRGGSTSTGSGPLPVCSSMIVSVRWPDALPVPSFLRSSGLRPARESLPTMRYVVPGWSAGRRPAGLEVDLVDLRPREQRHRHQPDDPQQQQDHSQREPEARPAAVDRRGGAREPGRARRRRGRRARGAAAAVAGDPGRGSTLGRGGGPPASPGSRRGGADGAPAGRVVVRRRLTRPAAVEPVVTRASRRRVRRFRGVGQPCG